jgi:hypothetical protein
MKQRVLLIGLFFYSFLVAADDTVLKLYRPFAGEQGIVADKKLMKGRCDAQSKLIIRDDAWRCQVEDKVFDPCFAKAGPKPMEVSCPLSPWTNEGVQISLSTPLNNEEHLPLDMSRTFPWAIELVNGEHCHAVEPGELYDSMPVRYRCTGESALVGTIQRCNPAWSMLEKTSNGVITMDLKQAWF